MANERLKSFREWEDSVKEYCTENGLNFDILNSLHKRWGIDLCDVVMPNGDVVLRIGRGTNGTPVFEQTTHISALKA